MVSVRVQRIGVPILDRFAARLSQRTNEDWAKWQLCRYAEIAVEMICYGLSRATRPSTTPESLFEEGRAPTFGDFRSMAQILAATKMMDDSAWGTRFFARVMQDDAAARALEIINAQRNDLAHGRRSLSLVKIKKHVTKGLKLESWGGILETDGEFQVLEWQPWARASSTESGQIGLFERWQKNALRYLAPETGEIFKVPRNSAVGSAALWSLTVASGEQRTFAAEARGPHSARLTLLRHGRLRIAAAQNRPLQAVLRARVAADRRRCSLPPTR